MKQKTILILLLTCVTAHAAGLEPATAAERSIVVTERGPVRGIVSQTVRMFLGIPYAAPPLGNLRWRPPENHIDWFTPLDAARLGNHCPQVASVFGTKSITEDCLFLNVFAPNDKASRESASRRHPVMVWIHAELLHEADDLVNGKLRRGGIELAPRADPDALPDGVASLQHHDAEFSRLAGLGKAPEDGTRGLDS